MCGIVGYIGKKFALEVLLNGLSKLEYRGYDSAGIALHINGKVEVVGKAMGTKKAIKLVMPSLYIKLTARGASINMPSKIIILPNILPSFLKFITSPYIKISVKSSKFL